jgi:hypothetical protein
MSVLIFSLLAVASVAGAAPAPDQPAGNPMRINACTLLTRDVVDKVKVAKTVVTIPPEEKPAGAKGSYCDYGGVGLQIDPFAGADQIRKSPQKDWVPVSGVGDTAYFKNVQNVFAELIVWSGSHHFAIQMEVPVGATAEQLKPNTIQLAHLIIPKLK